MTTPAKTYPLLILLTLTLLSTVSRAAEEGWISLLDGAEGMENFNQVGTANWRRVGGTIMADASEGGPGFLVTPDSYGDFELRVEFWASHDANSGIFVRCQDPDNITAANCYEVNIYDQRGDPSFGTGGIVGVASLAEPFPKAGDKWNFFRITLRGSRLTVDFNGEITADAQDDRFSEGPFALQWGLGVMRFRKVEIRPL